MLSPRYLDGLSDEIVEIYAQLETDILADMARRIARLGKVSEASKWQAQLLAETGALRKRVNSLLRKYDPAIQKEIKAIYNDALIKNARADNRIFTEALGHGVSDINAQVMLASIQKTHSDLSRLTITTAYTTETQFVQQANAAYMQVVSGAFDYDTATKNACKNLARDGITGVQYRNGRPVRLSIEAAARMNILTGVNQTASAMTMNNCDVLGCDLVETTAHIGARPEHEAWQGEVFSISGTNPKYRPFSVCELGTVHGICGINCRHSYYPYFEGLKTHYTADDLDEMSKQTVEYNGETMTRYEGEQKLRGIERKIRYYKREAATLEAGGQDATAAREKIGQWQATARDFTKTTGIKRDYAREFIGELSNDKIVNKSISLNDSKIDNHDIFKNIYTPKKIDGNIKNISDIKNMNNLAEYVKKEYNASITKEVTILELNSCKKVLAGIAEIKKQFPLLEIEKIGVADYGDILSYSMGNLTINPVYFNLSRKELENEIKKHAGEIFVKNANITSMGIHEAAHGIEWALIKLNKLYVSQGEKIEAWGGRNKASLEAIKIVGKSIKNILQTEYGINKTRLALIKSISYYATLNESEALAEAFADIFLNGINANPLSLEIKKNTILLYENYKKGVFTW